MYRESQIKIHNAQDGHDAVVFGWRGTVVDTSRWSETRVSSRGVGYVDARSGVYVPPDITNTVIENNEIWLRMSDGKEMSFRNIGVNARPGHEVMIVFCKNNPDAQTGKRIFVQNFTTGKTWEEDIDKIGITQTSMLRTSGAWSAAMLLGLYASSKFPNNGFLMTICGGAAFLVTLIFANKPNRKLAQEQKAKFKSDVQRWLNTQFTARPAAM